MVRTWILYIGGVRENEERMEGHIQDNIEHARTEWDARTAQQLCI